MKFKGIIRVFQNGKDGKIFYTTSIRGTDKNKEKKWASWYVNIPENKVIQNNTEIEVTDGYIKYYTNDYGYIQYVLVINEFKEPEVEYGDVALEEDAPAPDDSDLPF